MRRALVIRTAGDPDIAGAIVGGMMVPANTELAEIRTKMDAMIRREAVLGVRQVRDRNYWNRKIAEAEYFYGENPHHCKAVSAMIGMVGLVCELTGTVYKSLSAKNREA